MHESEPPQWPDPARCAISMTIRRSRWALRSRLCVSEARAVADIGVDHRVGDIVVVEASLVLDRQVLHREDVRTGGEADQRAAARLASPERPVALDPLLPAVGAFRAGSKMVGGGHGAIASASGT